nr:transmembrane protein 163 isoform X2 [Columba livia]
MASEVLCLRAATLKVFWGEGRCLIEDFSVALAVPESDTDFVCMMLPQLLCISVELVILPCCLGLCRSRMFQDDFLYSVSVLSGILCTVLAVIKFMLGKVLTSRALITDAKVFWTIKPAFPILNLTSRRTNAEMCQLGDVSQLFCFNSLVGGIMGFSILLSAEVFKHNSSVWFLDGSIGVLIGLTIFAYGIKLLIDMIPRVRQTRHYEMFE